MNSIGSIIEIWLTRLAMKCKDLGSCLACKFEGSSVVCFSIIFHESICPKLLLHFHVFLHILENQLFHYKLVDTPFKIQLIYFCQLMKFYNKVKKRHTRSLISCLSFWFLSASWFICFHEMKINTKRPRSSIIQKMM